MTGALLILSVLAAPPAEIQSMADLAHLYTQEGRTQEALELYAELRAAQPAEPKWWSLAADLLEKEAGADGELALLLGAWHRAQPGHEPATVRLFRFYMADGAWAEALGLLEKLPRTLEYARLRAELHETKDDRRGAIAAWTKVLGLPGAVPEDRWRRATLMMVDGDTPTLRAELEALVAARPGDPRFRVALGESLLGRDDLEGAEGQLREAQRSAPEDPGVLRLEAEIREERARRAADVATDARARQDDLRDRMDLEARVRVLLIEDDF